MTTSSARPVVALSIGDPAGIGPEIALRLLAEGDLPARVLLCGERRILERARALVGAGPGVESFADPAAFRASGADGGLDAASDDLGRAALPEGPPAWGRIDRGAGRASHAFVLRGADLALRGDVDALVTGPIHKEAWGLAGVTEPGHTEALAARAGVARVVMCLTGGGLRVALATIHVPLARVPSLLSAAGLLADLRIVREALRRDYGLAAPKIGVCGLNPHAGEGGRFGREDLDVIRPAVAAARAEGIDATGPLPADACIPRAASGVFDLAFAMFHDQGLPAVKTLAPRTAVNVTLGLPFVRTSVDHGTAFDVAGRGVATTSSLRAAVVEAVEIARARDEAGSRSIRTVTGPT
jgi:4-hydroxythreonine-4-phosphate dehydrogenase